MMDFRDRLEFTSPLGPEGIAEGRSDAGTSGCSGCEETRKRLDALEEQLAELRRKVRFMDAHIPYRIG